MVPGSSDRCNQDGQNGNRGAEPSQGLVCHQNFGGIEEVMCLICPGCPGIENTETGGGMSV